MAKCTFCGGEAEVGNMCADCANGFNSASPVRKSEIMKENVTEQVMKNCNVCGKLNNEPICIECLGEYLPKIKEYLDKYPSMSYLEAVGNKNIPVPRKVFYEFVEANIIKIRP